MKATKSNKYFISFLFVGFLFLLTLYESIADCTPVLLQPQEGAVLDNGCSPVQNDVTWEFDWEDCAGAIKFHIYVIRSESTYPAIDNDSLTVSELISTTSGYILDRNRLDWRWKVRAFIDDGWGEWSAERSFDVEPLNTDCQDKCIVRLTQPKNGKEIDNGCKDKSDIMSWLFDWTTCEGATKYHLRVANPNHGIVLIDNDSIESAIFAFNVNEYIPDEQQMGWRWKVRAFYSDKWNPWSEEFNFWVEPPDTDCEVTALETFETKDESIRIFPNPSSGYFTIQTSEDGFGDNLMSVNISGLDGKIVKSNHFEVGAANNFMIDITGLLPGIYIVKTTTSSFSATEKIIVQK